MPDQTDIHRLPFPLDSDSPDIPRDFRNLAEAIDPLLTPNAARIFSDATQRDNYFLTHGPPIEGQVTFLQSEDVPRYWDGTQWVWTYYTHSTRQTDVALTASTTYVVQWESNSDPWYSPPVGGTEIPVTYPTTTISLPRKGIYHITFNAAILLSTAGTCAFQIYDSSTGKYWMSDIGQYIPAGSQGQLGHSIIHAADVAGSTAVAHVTPTVNGTLLGAGLDVYQLR